MKLIAWNVSFFMLMVMIGIGPEYDYCGYCEHRLIRIDNRGTLMCTSLYIVLNHSKLINCLIIFFLLKY